MTQRLKDRRIVITGAASGMGRKIAELFAREGARTALLDRDEQPLKAIASETGAFSQLCNVASEADVKNAIAAAAATLGGLDGVVNAAGVVARTPIGQLDLATWQRVIDVNLTGTFLVCREALPFLEAAGGGTIVNFSSGAVLVPFAEIAAYGASKGGVVSLSKVLAMELGPKNIRVNAVCPGHIDTPMIRNPDPEAHRASLVTRAAQASLNRVGQPDEVANAVLFLTSAESSFINGSVISIDGGRAYH